ncbi:MAG: hypothetical protein WC343_04830 [Bacilli bacterium]|jgi:hypothetical protein
MALEVVESPGTMVEKQAPLNPVEIINLSAQKAVIDMFNKVNQGNTFNCNGTQGPSVLINQRLMQNGNPFPQFSIVNAAGADKIIYFGSPLGINGMYNRYNKATSAVDSAGMSDQFGANCLAVIGFNNLVNANPVIIMQVQMISSSATQIAQQWKYGDIDYDANIVEKPINVTQAFTRYDQDKTILKFGGVFAIGPQNYLAITSKAGVSMDIILTIAAHSSARSYTKMAV